MTLVSFAQNFEDVLLWRALGHVQNGRYIDIGAQDPIQDSVSKAFYDAGWRGVHVEPTPSYAAAIRANRPDETVIEAAVCDAVEPISFYEIPSTGMSTGDIEIARHQKKLGYDVRLISVPVIRLSAILDGIGDGDIHWMKIDVEGMEKSVLRSWSDSSARPWVVVIESTYPATQNRTDDQWHDLLIDLGYHPVHFDGLNNYYVSDLRSELDEKFSPPPNVFDAFSVTSNHFSARDIAALASQREGELIGELNRFQELLQARDVELHEVRVQWETHKAELVTDYERANELLAELENELANARQRFELREKDLLTQLGRLQERTNSLEEAQKRQRVQRSLSEKKLRREFSDTIDELRQLVERSKIAEATAQGEAGRLAEHASMLTEALRRTEEGRERVRQETIRIRAKLERELQVQRRDFMEIVTAAAEADVLIRALHEEPRGRWLLIGQRLGLADPSPVLNALLAWRAPSPILQWAESDSVDSPAANEQRMNRASE